MHVHGAAACVCCLDALVAPEREPALPLRLLIGQGPIGEEGQLLNLCWQAVLGQRVGRALHGSVAQGSRAAS